MPKVDIPKLRSLLKSGTAGPWEKTERNGLFRVHSIFGETSYASCGETVFEQGIETESDADLIVSAINALPEMLDELSSLRVRAEAGSRLRAALHRAWDGDGYNETILIEAEQKFDTSIAVKE